jgi:hypothetical protein
VAERLGQQQDAVVSLKATGSPKLRHRKILRSHFDFGRIASWPGDAHAHATTGSALLTLPHFG